MAKQVDKMTKDNSYLVCYFIKTQPGQDEPESSLFQPPLFTKEGERLKADELRKAVLRYYVPEIMLELGEQGDGSRKNYDKILGSVLSALHYTPGYPFWYAPSRLPGAYHEAVLFYVARHEEMDGVNSAAIFGIQHRYTPDNFSVHYFLNILILQRRKVRTIDHLASYVDEFSGRHDSRRSTSTPTRINSETRFLRWLRRADA